MEFDKGFVIQNINVSTLNNNMIQNEWNYEMINISSVWSQGLTGRGINIGLFDDGIDNNTEALTRNLNTSQTDLITNNLRLLNQNYNYTPINYRINTHGTQVAGIVCANGNVRGVAFNSSLIPVNILGWQTITGGDLTDLELRIFNIANLNLDIINKSYGAPPFPAVDNNGQVIQGQNALSIIQRNIETLKSINNRIKTFRNGRGGIVVSAAGNSGRSENNGKIFSQLSILDSPQNWSSNINVSAINRSGLWATYSNMGCNILCGAPAGGDYGIIPSHLDAIRTTYIQNRITTRMNGTSVAVSHISGLCALILEANLNLTCRQVKEIISRCSIVPVIDFSNDNVTLTEEQELSIYRRYDDSLVRIRQTNNRYRFYSLIYGYGVPNALECINLARQLRNISITEYEDSEFILMNIGGSNTIVDEYNPYEIPLSNNTTTDILNLSNTSPINVLRFDYTFNHVNRQNLTDSQITLEIIKISFKLNTRSDNTSRQIIHDLEMVLVAPDNTLIPIIRYYQYNDIASRYLKGENENINYTQNSYLAGTNYELVIMIEGLRGLNQISGLWRLLLTDRYDEETGTNDIKRIVNPRIKFYYSTGYPEYRYILNNIEEYYREPTNPTGPTSNPPNPPNPIPL